MIGTELHWLKGPWRGSLAMSARPRGGDWLADEIAQWRRSGIDAVVSFLEPSEDADLDLEAERSTTEANGLTFWSFPIPDRQVPQHERALSKLLYELDQALAAGKNIVLHCRQGVGRTGLIAACLLVQKGFAPADALESLSAARGLPVPETAEQRQWIERYAELSAPVV